MLHFIGDLLAKILPIDWELGVTLFPPTPTFIPSRDLPDLTGRTVLVTGGNSGIGLETVKQLLLKNAKVYLAARSEEKALEAIKRLKETTGKAAIFLQLDLGDLKSVRRAAEEFLGKEERLDVLINNAGVMVPPLDQLTTQGYDIQFGTNVLAHYFFTKLLIPALKKSSATTNVPARIVNVSSAMHLVAPLGGIDWKTLKGGPERDAASKTFINVIGSWRLYGQSKLGNILLSNYFARAYPGVIVSCSNHPGAIASQLTRYTGSFGSFMSGMFCYPTRLGALTQLWGGLFAPADKINGEYLIPWARIGRPVRAEASSVELMEKMVAWMDDELKGW